MKSLRKDWLSNIPNDLLAGLVVALALIPEAIAFSIIAGVDPKVGLYVSFGIAVVTAFVGGRSDMVSGATAAMAVLMVTLVKEHGLQYLLAATSLFERRWTQSDGWIPYASAKARMDLGALTPPVRSRPQDDATRSLTAAAPRQAAQSGPVPSHARSPRAYR